MLGLILYQTISPSDMKRKRRGIPVAFEQGQCITKKKLLGFTDKCLVIDGLMRECRIRHRFLNRDTKICKRNCLNQLIYQKTVWVNSFY